MELVVAADVAAIVRPAWAVVDPVRVIERDPAQDEPLRQGAAAMRTRRESEEITAAVRTMYKRVGLDPTKTRPSSEALLRRVRKGDELPRINSLVDVINWCSLESQLPFGLYDLNHVHGSATLRLGRAGEEYRGIRKDVVHVGDRLVLADADGPFGNPTSDSARTMVTTATVRALVVIFAPVNVTRDVAERALAVTIERIAKYCG
jgi:DNA/RNA-binding domain of Phe-tRNA-synthetase-like protein